MKKMLKQAISIAAISSLLFMPFNESSVGASEEVDHNPDLWMTVKPLETVVSFMNTGAHPDDERSHLLAYMSLGHGVNTTSLIANRGEGGQNVIGTELGNGLGIIRSMELEDASEVLNMNLRILSQELDDDIYDFGFSKTVEETLEEWGEEVTYERLIRGIREERPDILFTSFLDVPSQHGHHRAMTVLTQQAFEDAGDPEVFPEHQEEGLAPWQPLKFYLPGTEETETLNFNIGIYDEVYEKTYPQLGEDSRYLHVSQGMGRDLPVEDLYFSLNLAGSVVNSDEESIFSGIPYDFKDYGALLEDADLESSLDSLQDQLNSVVDAYPDQSAVFDEAHQALNEVLSNIQTVEDGHGDLTEEEQVDLLSRLEVKEDQLKAVIEEATEIEITLDFQHNQLTRGAETEVDVSITNNGDNPIDEIDIELMTAEKLSSEEIFVPDEIPAGDTAEGSYIITVDDNAEFFDPYADDVVEAVVSYSENSFETEQLVQLDETVAVLPDFGIELNPEGTIFNILNEDDVIDFEVDVTNYVDGENNGTISLDLPEGLESEPSEASLNFQEQGEQQQVAFEIYAEEMVDEGLYDIAVIASGEGGEFSTIVQEISYPHVNDSYWLRNGKLSLQAFPLEMDKDLKVGYIDSGFDTVASNLRDANMDVEYIDEETLLNGDLSQYDTIVTGIRVYNSREDLLENNDRLLQYVEDGGHVVMQYHNPNADNWSQSLAPYPLQPGTPSIEWRVTNKEAEITKLVEDHPFYNQPNAITDQDFEGWVQERGLYFVSEWDDAYTPLMSMADPNEDQMEGGLLVTEYGEGTFVYTSLSWYRQIQNQVPGGYRLFTNLISYPHVEAEVPEVTADEIITLVEQFDEEGEFESDEAVRSLVMHLTAVSLYENQEDAEKIVRHMDGFKFLLDYQNENNLISEEAFDALSDHADALIEKWE